MIKKTRQIQESKRLMNLLPSLEPEVPEYLYLATANARCPKYELYIKEGERVLLGQVIGMRHAAFFDQPIQSTCSGTFEGFEKHYHRSGKAVDFIKIHNDFKDELAPEIKDRTDEEVASLSKDGITKILKDTSSVGLGGSSFPTYVKFDTNLPIKHILINGIECEPYISADQKMMRDHGEAIAKTMLLLKKVFNAEDVLLCIKCKHMDLVNMYRKLFSSSEYAGKGIDVFVTKDFYPEGWELELIRNVLHIDVPQGKLPAECGVLDFNVSTLYGMYLSIYKNMPVYERYISVTGDAIDKPSNLIVRVGTPMKFIIDKCGGYRNPDKDKVFILGGPMMGASLPNDDCIVTKTVTSVIVMDYVEYKAEPCIRCGSCVYSCPTGLKPVEIMNVMKVMPVDKQKVKDSGVLRCIECGLCTYSCTSKIHLLDFIRRAKVVARLP